jgi:alkanesulfonate monooxygenase SsuD/methylene tetrahydromethanopterin reductase-like flavin-dependent oxidoreductase (luciferase family)
MRVGVGLPATVPGASAALLLEWARRADAGPFTSLGVLDRVVYESYDPFLALALAAGVTTRVRLATTIVIAPLRAPALLAKSAATLHAVSSGRLVLGMAVGARPDDYTATGGEYATRGRRFAEQLATLHARWGQPETTPLLADLRAPEVLVGGLSDTAFARAARYADGYVHGGGPPRAFARAAEKARAAWHDLDRPRAPQLWAQGYFALGGTAVAEAGARYLREYYAFTGPFVERIVDELLTTPQQVAQFVRGYEDAGCDELVLFPSVPDLDQLDRLAAVIGDRR